MKTIEEKHNNMLNRKEVKVIVEAEKNPSYDEACEIISKEFKCDKEHTAVKLVRGKFGRNTFLISGFIYKSKEDRDKIEPKKKVKKVPGSA